MGMYDNLHIEAPLPDPEYQERTFQTKSLECSLSDYTITRDGHLVLRQVEWETTPEAERPFYGTEQWERGGLFQLCGMLREASSRYVTLDEFHGDIVFYDTVNAPDDALFAIDFRKRFWTDVLRSLELSYDLLAEEARACNQERLRYLPQQYIPDLEDRITALERELFGG
jgi:hypothetical protein